MQKIKFRGKESFQNKMHDGYEWAFTLGSFNLLAELIDAFTLFSEVRNLLFLKEIIQEYSVSNQKDL